MELDQSYKAEESQDTYRRADSGWNVRDDRHDRVQVEQHKYLLHNDESRTFTFEILHDVP